MSERSSDPGGARPEHLANLPLVLAGAGWLGRTQALDITPISMKWTVNRAPCWKQLRSTPGLAHIRRLVFLWN